jgi:hypothetical protein
MRIESEIKFESKSFTILFYGNSLNSARDCIQIVVTVVVTKDVYMSRRWKSELVACRIRKQPSPRSMHLLTFKPDRSAVCLVCPESVQHLVITLQSRCFRTVHRNRPYG